MSLTSLSDYRARKSAAMAYHPAIWTPQDAIDTAQAFHAEIRHAERGESVRSTETNSRVHNSRWTAKLFGRSRFRRARIYDGLAVGLLLALMAALGVIVFAASAKADPDSDVAAWTAEYGPAVCLNLDDHNSLAGVYGTGLGIMDYGGMSAEQAGQVMAMSVYRICPRHIPLLERFVAVYGERNALEKHA